MNFFPDFAPNSKKEWRLLLFQSNLRKQIRKLPKILKFVRIIHYYSKLFTGVLIHDPFKRAADVHASRRLEARSGLSIEDDCRSNHPFGTFQEEVRGVSALSIRSYWKAGWRTHGYKKGGRKKKASAMFSRRPIPGCSAHELLVNCCSQGDDRSAKKIPGGC